MSTTCDVLRFPTATDSPIVLYQLYEDYACRGNGPFLFLFVQLLSLSLFLYTLVHFRDRQLFQLIILEPNAPLGRAKTYTCPTGSLRLSTAAWDLVEVITIGNNFRVLSS